MQSTAVRLKERGVSDADYLIDGCRVLHAIDRWGNCVRRIKLTAEVDEEVARAWLEGYLEHVDPLPRLHLIKPAPAPPTPMHPGLLVRYLKHRR